MDRGERGDREGGRMGRGDGVAWLTGASQRPQGMGNGGGMRKSATWARGALRGIVALLVGGGANLACTPESATRIESPDGVERYELFCPEGASQCMHDARDACGGAFAVDYTHGDDYLETNSSGTAHATQIGNSAFATSSGHSVTRKRREVTLRVTCKKKGH
jgi:hypothetical protein